MVAVFEEIRIYFEGSHLLRPGFRQFFRELQNCASGRGVKVTAISAEGTPCQDFAAAIKSHPYAWNILLKDSEGPLTAKHSASLCKKNGWDKSQARSIFWMVEMMGKRPVTAVLK